MEIEGGGSIDYEPADAQVSRLSLVTYPWRQPEARVVECRFLTKERIHEGVMGDCG